MSQYTDLGNLKVQEEIDHLQNLEAPEDLKLLHEALEKIQSVLNEKVNKVTVQCGMRGKGVGALNRILDALEMEVNNEESKFDSRQWVVQRKQEAVKEITNIFQNGVVQTEMKRIRFLIGEDNGRNVEYDLHLLQTALKKLNPLVNGEVAKVTLSCDMWEECIYSLDFILGELDLDVDGETSEFDFHQWDVVKKTDFPALFSNPTVKEELERISKIRRAGRAEQNLNLFKTILAQVNKVVSGQAGVTIVTIPKKYKWRECCNSLRKVLASLPLVTTEEEDSENYKWNILKEIPPEQKQGLELSESMGEHVASVHEAVFACVEEFAEKKVERNVELIWKATGALKEVMKEHGLCMLYEEQSAEG